jgi:hypothetical protein
MERHKRRSVISVGSGNEMQRSFWGGDHASEELSYQSMDVCAELFQPPV